MDNHVVLTCLSAQLFQSAQMRGFACLPEPGADFASGDTSLRRAIDPAAKAAAFQEIRVSVLRLNATGPVLAAILVVHGKKPVWIKASHRKSAAVLCNNTLAS